jgi:ABC-2 type transport system permease protein
VAHQWWGHQVMAANVQGTTMVVESLSAYSALMVMKKQYGSEHMRQFLRRELDTYLVGRGRDKREETPLYLVDNQQHIHYAKGSLVFYRLAEEIGEDAVNRALKKFIEEKAFKGAPFATSIDLIKFIRAEAKPEQQQLITDLFEKICLYDNRVADATAVKRADGRYDVTFKVTSSKVYADGKGAETAVPMDDNIELAVFSRPASGKEKDETVLHIERQRVTSGAQTIHWVVDKKPYEVGIDPYNKLIDRISADNRKRVN